MAKSLSKSKGHGFIGGKGKKPEYSQESEFTGSKGKKGISGSPGYQQKSGFGGKGNKIK